MSGDVEAPRPRRLIGREQVRRILWGCSIATVRKLEREGKLAPIRAPIGETGRIRVRFDPEKVHAIKPDLAHLRDRLERRAKTQKWDAEDGEREAQVFEAIRAGMSKQDIVMKLRVPSAAVVEMRESYMKTFADHDREATRDRKRREDQLAQREHDKEVARREREERAAAEERKRRKDPPTAVTVETCPRRVLHPGIALGARCGSCSYEGKA